MAAGTKAAFAVRADGRLFTWGAVKVGTATSYEVARPVEVRGLENIVQVAAGGKHYLALDRTGRVWSWGESNQWGELGRDPDADHWVPGVVDGLDDVCRSRRAAKASMPRAPFATTGACGSGAGTSQA